MKYAEISAELQRAISRSPCGERGLKFTYPHGANKQEEGRSPCGERGLKCKKKTEVEKLGVSLPVRGAWIEINMRQIEAEFDTSLPVRGAWIEIIRGGDEYSTGICRSPCGERGLKSPLRSEA